MKNNIDYFECATFPSEIVTEPFDHQLRHNRPPNEITKHNQPSAHTSFLPFESRKNHQRWILYQQPGPASGKQNYRAEGTVSPSPGFRPRRFLTREKKRREERENGKDRAKKRRQSKQKTKRKIRMNTRRIRKCLGDRHNMTFRSSITEEISSSRLLPLEGGALTIRGKKYPRDILSFPLRPFVHILTMHTGLEEDSKLFIVLDCGMKRFWRIEDKRRNRQRSVKISSRIVGEWCCLIVRLWTNQRVNFEFYTNVWCILNIFFFDICEVEVQEWDLFKML